MGGEQSWFSSTVPCSLVSISHWWALPEAFFSTWKAHSVLLCPGPGQGRVGVAGFCPSSLIYYSKLSCVLGGWNNPPRKAEEPKGGGSEVRATRLDVTSAFVLDPALPPTQPLSCCFPGRSSTSK